MGNFKDLLVWRKADELAFQIYRVTRIFPKDEMYGLVSQIRRAAVSVSTNLAEGSGRQNRKEVKQFANIALGSLSEVESLLSFSQRLGFMESSEFVLLDKLRGEVAALLWRFYQSL